MLKEAWSFVCIRICHASGGHPQWNTIIRGDTAQYFQVVLPPNSDPNGSTLCKATVITCLPASQQASPHAGVQIIFYFLYSNVQVAFAFLTSCFLSKARTAQVVSQLWIIACALVFSQVFATLITAKPWLTTLLQLVPTFGAFRRVPSRTPALSIMCFTRW
jgi:hypothetical protein